MNDDIVQAGKASKFIRGVNGIFGTLHILAFIAIIFTGDSNLMLLLLGAVVASGLIGTAVLLFMEHVLSMLTWVAYNGGGKR